jgi:hypothetical protein
LALKESPKYLKKLEISKKRTNGNGGKNDKKLVIKRKSEIS